MVTVPQTGLVPPQPFCPTGILGKQPEQPSSGSHCMLAGQLFLGETAQLSHVCDALQMGVVDGQPWSSDESLSDAPRSHCAHTLLTHCCLPSVRAAQSVSAMHSTQCASLPAPTQR